MRTTRRHQFGNAFVFATVVALASGATACATLLDFQDAQDLLPLTIAVERAPDAAATPVATDDSPVVSSDAHAPTDTDANADADADADANASVVQTDDDDAATAAACGPSSRCVPAVTDDWQGPLVFQERGANATAPTCADDYAMPLYDGFADPNAPPATCACACNAPSGSTCTSPIATFFKDNACAQPCTATAAQSLVANACTTLPASTFACPSMHLVVSASVASGGSCTPTLTKQVTPVDWTSAARLCGATIAPTALSSCGGGRLCAPNPKAPFDTSICIAQEGAWSCPTGYPTRHIYRDVATTSDTRTCTACSCGSPSGVSCGGSVEAFHAVGNQNTNGQCTTASSTTPLALACTSVNTMDRVMVVGASPISGTCPPSGGVAMGAFDPGVPTTVCCTSP